jgi:hypothetical protein
MSRIVIHDWLAWGNLVKTWTTGASYFPSDKRYPRPKTIDELKSQLVDSRAGSVPDWVIDFELIDWSEERLLIELPSSQMIFDAEAFLRLGKAYPLPVFYRQALGDLHGLDGPNARLTFHTMRIGERAISALG